MGSWPPRSFRWRSKLRRRSRAAMSALASITIVVLMGPLLVAQPALAAPTAAMTLAKTADETSLVPGDTFNYRFQVGCSTLQVECINAVLEDTIPSQFVVGSPASINVTPEIPTDVTIDGQALTVRFEADLSNPLGQVGLSNQVVTVVVPVTVRSDLPHTPTPLTISNTATVDSDNTIEQQSTETVELMVPIELGTTASKSFSPSTVLGVAGSPTTVTFGGTNTSNTPVDTFIIQDPSVPAVATGIFAETLLVGALDSVVWPTGATTATVSVWNSATSAWVDGSPVAAPGVLALPAAVPEANIRGVRVTFTSGGTAAIPTGAIASLSVDTTLRHSGSGARSNISSSSVAIDATTASDTETQSLTLQAATSTVTAGKTIVPDRIATVAFEDDDATSALVTLTGANSGTVPLQSLTISEPSDPSSLANTNPLAPAHVGGGLLFGAIGSVVWPNGATGASMQYFYADGSTTTASTTSVNTLPAPQGTERVTGFRAIFTGAAIVPSAAATIPFTVLSNPAQVAPVLQVDYSNTVAVGGENIFGAGLPAATATDTVTVFSDQVSISTTKAFTRGQLATIAGQRTIATLSTTIAPYPQSTRRVDSVSMYDPPLAEAGLTDWFNYVNATQLTLTNVPSGATLTVRYRDSLGVYNDIPGFVDLNGTSGPITQVIPSGIRDDIYGLQFLWENPAGFVPGQTLTANIDYGLRSTLRDDSTALPNVAETLENCSSATATASGLPPASADSTCPMVALTPTGGGGGGSDGITLSKRFYSTGSLTDQTLINTRSNAQTRVRLTWSMGGITGAQTMTISDSAPTPSMYTKGMYDAFNLARINAVNGTLDPQVQYDQFAVELFNVSTNEWETPPAWITASPAGSTRHCTVDDPCTSFPQTDLNAPQRELYVGIRFVFTERPNRTVLNPAPGSGVSSLAGNRSIDLVFQIRDSLRSSASTPVVNGYRYNYDLNGVNSVVLNDAAARAVLDAETLTAAATDTIQLQDPNLALTTTKVWDGGPLPIPDSATVTPQPTSRVTLGTQNTTVGGIATTLSIVEPNPSGATPNDSPFEVFDLTRFVLAPVSHPANATGLTVTVRNGLGATIVTASGTPAVAWAAAAAWTPAQLANAESFTLDYAGRMATNARAIVRVDMTVRATERTTGDPVAAGTEFNSVQGAVGDVRFVVGSDINNPTFAPSLLPAVAGDDIDLLSSTIAVTPTKAFTTTSQVEPTRTPITVTLAAQPGGSERVASLTMTDDRATFWNTFDFVEPGTITLPVFSSPGGTARLQVEVCTGGVFDAVDIAATPAEDCAERGGTWTTGPWLTQANLTGGAFLPAGVSAGDVNGIRLTVERVDGAQWENPAAPTVSIPLSVQRRENLRSGGAVPSDYAGNTAAPGETVLGTTTNGLSADVVGIWGKSTSDSTTATYRYVHLTTSVQVQKLPTGVRSPGVAIPYTLRMTNTGQAPILNPVITDTLPTDVSGDALLIFNPDAVTSYTFALSGGSVPDGSIALPTGVNPATATVTPTISGPGPSSIEFTFPTGTVLGVGQTYIITVPLFFRPGIGEGTSLINSFEIRGDRLFNACTAPAGSTSTSTSAGFGCTTATTIEPSLSPAVRAYVSVRAETTTGIDFPTDEFTGGTQLDCLAARDINGFSRPPCAPTTIPGQETTWRNTIENTGTTSFTRLVVAMRLPTTGDETIVSGLTRNSRWLAQFAGDIVTSFGAATVTPYYTTALEPCAGVLQTPTNPAACGTNPTTGWAELPAGGLPDPSIVTGLQFIMDFPDGDLFDPAEAGTIDFTTRTVAQLDVFEGSAGPNPLAVNSLSVSGLSRSGTVETPIVALDYSRAVAGLATGSVVLDKTVTGPAADFVPDGQTFTGELVCTSLGVEFTRPWTMTADVDTSTDPNTITVPSVTIDGLPGGSRCTATETDASGQTTVVASTVSIDPLADPANLPIVTVGNGYELAGLLIEKTVTADPAVVVPTDFPFTVECTFLGQPIPLSPTDAAFTLDAGESKVITGIPANSTCLVTETDNLGADLTVVNATTDPDPDQGSSLVEDDSARTVEFTRLSPVEVAGEPINQVDFDNRFDAPALVTISKLFDGGDAAIEQFGDTATFSVELRCTFENSVQFDGPVVLSAANGFSESIDNLLSDSVCEVSEPDLNGADAAVITVDGVDTDTFIVPAPSVAVPSPLVDVVVTNWFLTGSLEVTKEFDGDTGAIEKFVTDVGPEVEFTIELECVRGGEELELLGGNERVLTARDPVVYYTQIASGAECVLTETATGGAVSWRVLDAAGDLVADGAFDVEVVVPTNLDDLDAADQAQPPLTVENTFRFAEVAVAKTIAPDPQGVAGGEFEFDLQCTLDGREIEAAEDAKQVIGAGEQFTWTELAEGADCVLTELETGGAARVDHMVTLPDGTQSEPVTARVVTLAPLRGASEEPNLITFINWYSLPNTGVSVPPAGLAAFAGFVLLAGASLLGIAALRRSRRGEYTAD